MVKQWDSGAHYLFLDAWAGGILQICNPIGFESGQYSPIWAAHSGRYPNLLRVQSPGTSLACLLYIYIYIYIYMLACYIYIYIYLYIYLSIYLSLVFPALISWHLVSFLPRYLSENSISGSFYVPENVYSLWVICDEVLLKAVCHN